ncbi:hypothetical protein ES332_D03G043600v1 [Gossypium tomentosum]|uniref:Uncharacterized protein n=1 Tax=Gossypium tomentosum TaxID=34277 RepID=A0A5D2LIV5_GOSTO|nr:hypothetical protein ES332_D03G043600v1 [Gossypium tomentosum]
MFEFYCTFIPSTLVIEIQGLGGLNCYSKSPVITFFLFWTKIAYFSYSSFSLSLQQISSLTFIPKVNPRN